MKKALLLKLLSMSCFLVIHIHATSMITNRKLATDANWGTHMAPLMTAVLNTTGPILEMGCGDFSTPLLHALCASKNRFLLSTECDKKWLELFLDLETDWHLFKHIPGRENPKAWDSIGNECHWSVVFIDHAPGERRVIDIQRLRSNADIIVVHDTETASYGYEQVLNTFKYRFVYKRYATQTTLVSDTIDVAALF